MESKVEYHRQRISRAGEGLLSASLLMVGVLVCVLGYSDAQEVSSSAKLPRPAPVIPLATDVNSFTSVSVSKQFVVHGKSLALRSAFSKFAESVKGDYLDLLYSTGRGTHPERIDQWRNQIVIQIRDDAADPVQGSVTSRIQRLVPEGFRLELTARIGTEMDREELREELIRLLLAESILRDHKTIRTGGRTEILPNWLMAGVTEILRQKVHGRPSDLYEKVFTSGSVLSVEEILTTEPKGLDSLSEKIFELSSAGLIQTLLEQVAGANRMRSFVSELAVFTGPQKELLLKHFPGLRASRNSLSKWWALQMATMSEPGVFEWMTAEETEMALNDALIVEFKVPVESGEETAVAPAADPKKKESLGDRVRRLFGGGSARAVVPDASVVLDEESELVLSEEPPKDPEMQTVTCRIEDVALYLKQKNLSEILLREQADLARISSRAHPLYRAVIQSYQATIGSLNAESDIGEAETNFAELIARRTTIQRQAEAITDHLNWYEATQLNQTSGKFDRFFEARDAIENDVRRRRSDPISKYLDALQREFRQ
ncbi:MAG: hypothetical protein R3F19_13335 [Verrucomicrobiales bacterium]